MDTRSDIPLPQSAVLAPGGRFAEVWWRFFLTLWNRTGGADGEDADALRRLILDLQAAVEGQQYGNALAQIQAALDEGQMPADVAQAAAMGVIGCMAAEALQRCESLVPIRIQVPGGGPVNESSARARGDFLPPEPYARQSPPILPPEVWAHGIHEAPELHAVATPTSAGFMSAADKAKLDGL
ncbi:hypothetical protein GCM10023144_01250 [Pigmentiphaga soli]|uniref:Uncharacterized protein n=1 Tax=Pigmentiphaga soli TaxID=1007095 RepID=A0ABP8GDA3_9BURK